MSGTQPSAGTSPNTSSPAVQDTGQAAPPPAPRRSPAVLIAVVIVVIIIAGVVGYGAYAGWFSSKSTSSSGFPSCDGTPTLSSAGSTFVAPLANEWAYNFHTASNCLQVGYNPIGSGSGITEFTGKLIDIGASDAPLSYAQTKALPAAAVQIPWALGAVSIVYNVKGVPTGLNLTGTILSEIFLGNITTWNNSAIVSLNAKYTAELVGPIIPTWRSDGSGTSYVFTGFLSQASTFWKAKYGQTLQYPSTLPGQGEHGSTGVAGYVGSTAGAIGYVELNYAKSGNIPYAAIQNPAANFILPNATNTAAAAQGVGGSLPAGSGNWSGVSILNQPGAQTYPMATFTYAIVYQELSNNPSFSQNLAEWVVAFLYWCVNTGQGQSSPLYYVPLPSDVIAVNDATINSLTYNGAAIPTFGGD